ncbi:unnamed protein product [Cylicocyclus nassatus]|uniref:Uncharacterized protein n=1 Tax=Cylicocyclus nassatus TaxID=53992 RepID=A0AA36HG26_CYLNA|nr:unnamed protein product [Cylicocyclus nassatus]
MRRFKKANLKHRHLPADDDWLEEDRSQAGDWLKEERSCTPMIGWKRIDEHAGEWLNDRDVQKGKSETYGGAAKCLECCSKFSLKSLFCPPMAVS